MVKVLFDNLDEVQKAIEAYSLLRLSDFNPESEGWSLSVSNGQWDSIKPEFDSSQVEYLA